MPHPETKAGPTKDHVDNLSTWNATDNLATAFSSVTADASGRDELTVRRAAARGESPGDDLAAVTGT